MTDQSSDLTTAQCLLGLIGSGIQASKSPALHEAEAAAQGFQCRYELIDLDRLGVGIEHLPVLLAEAERRGFSGLNITYPCKQAVIPFLHELSPQARTIGAVNTVHFNGGRRIGYNTDAWGFAESFRQDMKGSSIDTVAQVGAGGAGAATAFALLELGARRLRLVDSEFSRAEALSASLSAQFPERDIRAWRRLDEAVGGADGIVNATPMGMARHPGSAIPAHLLAPGLWVADIVYFPLKTELLRAARAAGSRTLDGGGMAVYQAVRAFEIFTGRAADAVRMRRHFERIVGH
ncbi:MAG: shikimate dehydrogenase [Gammaproteobacteria bacterium]|nr:shikimate dehydrogenase [Gammaproteobacteria bacterium]